MNSWVELDENTDAWLMKLANEMKISKSEIMKLLPQLIGKQRRDNMDKDEAKKVLSEEAPSQTPMDSTNELVKVISTKHLLREIRREDGKNEGDDGMDIKKIMELQMLQDMMANRNKPSMDPMMMMMMLSMMNQGKNNQNPEMMEIMRQSFEAAGKRSEDAMQTLMQKTYGDEQAKLFMAKFEELKNEMNYNRQEALEDRARRSREPEGDPVLGGIKKGLEYKNELENLGVLGSKPEEERRHDREVQAQASQHHKEIRQMDIVDSKTSEIGQSIDRKLDQLIMLLADEQRVRLRQMGLEPVYKPMSEQEQKESAARLERALAEQEAASAKQQAIIGDKSKEEPR